MIRSMENVRLLVISSLADEKAILQIAGSIAVRWNN